MGWEVGMLPLLSLRHWRAPVAVTSLSYHAEPRSGRYWGPERRGEARVHRTKLDFVPRSLYRPPPLGTS